MMADLEPMQVAVRIRPLSSGEVGAGCIKCVKKVDGEPQVVVGHSGNTAFTYSYVFDDNDTQKSLYTRCVKPILPKIFEGYNVTILAYGQTGSGKSYTMGTNCSENDSAMGVIQRSIDDIFQRIDAVDEEYDVRVSFLELYNETLYDLLTGSSREASVVELRENSQGMQIQGLCRRHVSNIEEAMLALQKGSSLRVTGATNMNATSSRSHAVFTISVTGASGNSSKFHLVDLAGSERAKKTGTAGDRFKEGVSINKGLLALGNVISQLSEGASFVNYRDSLLTRLLRDSLGGNSYTLMIACIGPADSNEDETLSTLRYADRVLKIKNKPIVNKDPLAAVVEQMKREIAELKLSALSGGNNCPPSHALLEAQLRDEMKKNSIFKANLQQNMTQCNTLQQRNLMMDTAMESMKKKITQLLPFVEQFGEDNKTLTVVNLITGLQKDLKDFDSEMADHSKMLDKMDEDEENIDMLDEMVSRHIESNQQIEDVSNCLLLKQQLYDELTTFTSKYGDVDQSSVERLETLVQQLMAEKAELISKLEVKTEKQSKQPAINSGEVKNRLKQLEKELSQAQKRLNDQARLIKMKEKSDEKIITLEREIQNLKTLKVNLVHSMKAEFGRFKALQTEKNREVCKLRSLTNRQSNEINRIQKELVLKQAVWRRKLEAAAAAKRKMEAALAKRNLQRKNSFKVAKVEEFITAEVDVLESTLQAKQSVRKIMDDRAAVTHELQAIEASIKQAKPGSQTADLEKRKRLLQQDIDLQNAQIADLQQRILDLEPDSKRPFWEDISSVVEARHALNVLFKIFARVKCDLVHEQDTLADVKTEYEAKLAEVEKLKSEIRKEKERKRILKECDSQMYSMITGETSPPDETVYMEASQNVSKSRVLQPITENNQSVKPPSEMSYEDVFMSFVKNQTVSKTTVQNENIPKTPVNRRPSSTIEFSSVKRPKVTFNFEPILPEKKLDDASPSNATKTPEELNTTFIVDSN